MLRGHLLLRHPTTFISEQMIDKPTKVMPDPPTNLEHVMAARGPAGATRGGHGRHFHEDLGIRIDRDGVWYYHGSAIQRKELVCLFASVLERDADGRYWLITPAEMGEVAVADAPFVAVEMFLNGGDGDQLISLRTNVDQIVTVDAAHPLSVVTDPATGEPTPYVALDRNLSARIVRAVYYHLVAHGVERTVDGRRVLGVWSAGTFFELGALDDA